MALFDKVKQQASQVAAKAQEAGKAGQQKLADAQAKRRADGMLRELGLAAYSEQAGRGPIRRRLTSTAWWASSPRTRPRTARWPTARAG